MAQLAAKTEGKPGRSADDGSHRSSPQHFRSQESTRVMFFIILHAKWMIEQNWIKRNIMIIQCTQSHCGYSLPKSFNTMDFVFVEDTLLKRRQRPWKCQRGLPYHEGKPNYKWICELWNSNTFIWPHSICQVKLDFLGVDWSIIHPGTLFKFWKRKIRHRVFTVLKRRINFTSLRTLCLKEFVPKDVTHEQCCCFARETNFL